MNENWKAIEGYENYEISDHGNVKNIKTNRMLKLNIDSNGYHQVSLCNNGKQTNLKIHRLVAEAFLENPDDKLCVDHIDRDKLNNHISNLNMCSPFTFSFRKKDTRYSRLY